MKRIFGVIAFVCLAAVAQAGPIPITGTIRTPQGTLLTGRVDFTLSYAASQDSCSSNVTVASRVSFPVRNGLLAANAQLVPNTCLVPFNTTYTAEYFNNFGQKLAQNIFYVSGTQFNLGTATPTTITTSNISFPGPLNTGVPIVGNPRRRGTVIVYPVAFSFSAPITTTLIMAPDGTVVNQSGTTTAGLQEALNYAANNGYDLYITGGEELLPATCSNTMPMGSGPTCNQINYVTTTAWTWPPLQGMKISAGSVFIGGAGSVSGANIITDSMEMVQVDFSAAQVGSIKFKPTHGTPLDGLIAIQDSDISVMTPLGSNSAGAVEFDPSVGSIVANRINFVEANAGNGTGSGTAGYGIIVDNTTMNTQFRGNIISAAHVHGTTIAGISECNTSPPGLCGGNIWNVTISTENAGAKGINTFGSKDIWNISAIDGVQGPTGIHVLLEASATGNTVNVGSTQNAMFVQDLGSNNIVTNNGQLVTKGMSIGGGGDLTGNKDTTNDSIIKFNPSNSGFSVYDCDKTGSGTVLPCQFQVGGTAIVNITTTGLFPSLDNTYAAGASSLRFSTIGTEVINSGLTGLTVSTNANTVSTFTSVGGNGGLIVNGTASTPVFTNGILTVEGTMISESASGGGSSKVITMSASGGDGKSQIVVTKGGSGTTQPMEFFSDSTLLATFQPNHPLINSITAEVGTKDALCRDSSSGEVEINSGVATCTVSSLRYKDWLHDLSCKDARRIVKSMRPAIFKDKDGIDGPRFGFAAEWTAKVEPRLVDYESDGVTPRAVDYERYVAVLTRYLQCK